MNKAQQKSITHIIYGLGVSGLSCARYFDRIEQPYYLADTRERPPAAEQIDSLEYCQGYSFGAQSLKLLDDCQMIVVSPGISLKDPFLVQARSREIELVGDVELFARHCGKKIVAITGSNGKSTVTELSEALLRAAGVNAQKGGNIGLPVLDFLPADEADVYVLEVSSFQMDTTKSLQADVAVLLNISEDHMDRYESFEHYGCSKRRIFENAKCKIFNWDDRLTLPTEIDANDLSFSLEKPKEVNHVVSYLDKNESDYEFVVNEKTLTSTRDLKITGFHNWLNALASLSILHQLNVAINQDVLDALINYQGLAHRFQLVSRKMDCLWINDSKATNVGATVAALNSLKQFSDQRVFLIAGGDSKNADLNDLQGVLDNSVYRLILLGKDADRLAEVSRIVPYIKVENLQQAVKAISPELNKGDIVLLSPACASLDMFKNFEERGNAFIAAVEECA